MSEQILIIGAGLAGLLTAKVLADNNFDIILIEKGDIAKRLQTIQDGRVIAISNASAKFLSEQNLWQYYEDVAAPIKQIRVADQNSPLFLHFDNELVDNVDLGYMVDIYTLVKELYKNLINHKNIKLFDNLEVTKISQDNDYVTISTNKHNIFKSKILLAADGKDSKIRDYVNINVQKSDYKQIAIICNIHHEKKHQNIAHEIFLPAGPFAILPLKDSNQSAIVWSEKIELEEIYKTMSKEKIAKKIFEKTEGFLGKIKIISDLFFYPLSVSYVTKYFNNRVCLIGDSAHAIHPIAGQGFNLTIRDIKEISTLFEEYRDLGLDIGAYNLLKTYQKRRMIDNMSMIFITDQLTKLFSNNSLILSKLRRIGLGLVNNSDHAKKFFMKKAMGY